MFGRDSSRMSQDGAAAGCTSTGSQQGPEHSGAAAAAMSITISDDDADMAMVLELARRAHCLLEEDQRELARLEAEKSAAERERREKQEREKAERARLELERQSRERVEAAERERSAAEKRERARAEKQAARAKGVKLDLAAVAAPPQAPAAGKAAKGAASKKQQAAAGNGSAPNPAAAPYIPSPAAAAAAGVAVSAPAAAAAAAGRKDYRSVVGGSKLESQRSGGAPAKAATVLPPRPPYTADQQLVASQLPARIAASMGLQVGVGSQAGAHARGDSLETLGDPTLKLNKDMLDALDLVDDASLGNNNVCAQAAAASMASSGHGARNRGAGVGRSPMSQLVGDGHLVNHHSGSSSHYPAGGGHMDGISQQASSAFSSATSADELLASQQGAAAAAPCAAPGMAVLQQAHGHCSSPMLLQHSLARGSGGELFQDASTTAFHVPHATALALGGADWGAAPVAGARRLGFVDLGGASWGLDAPSLGVPGVPTATASLFPSLNSSIPELTSLLGGEAGMWQQMQAASGAAAGAAAANPASAFDWGDASAAGLGPEGVPGAMVSALAAAVARHGSFEAAVTRSFDAAATRLWGASPNSGAAAAAAPLCLDGGLLSLRGSTGSLQPGRLAAANPADVHHAGMNGSAHNEWEDSMALSSTGGSGRVCRYHLAGFCREGMACRFAHPALSGSAGALAGVGGGVGLGVVPGSGTLHHGLSGASGSTGGIGSLAYGAPGTDAFGGPAAGVRSIPSKHTPLAYDSQSVSSPATLGRAHTLQSCASGRSMYGSVLGDGAEDVAGAAFQLPDSLEFE